jgi:hypothetical protein
MRESRVSRVVRVASATSRNVKRAALYAAPSVFLVLCTAAEATDQNAPQPREPRTVVFGSVDGGHSSFGTIGAKRTLFGSLDQSGPVGMASLGYGGTVERLWWHPAQPRAMRHALHASALLGYQWVRDGLVAAAFAGPEIEGERLDTPALPRDDETHLGARLHGEVWAHPTAGTLLTTTLIAGTARAAHLWGRASAGYAFWNGVFLGPEASVYTTDTYREWRVGAHVTGVTLGRFNLRLSGGWRTEEETRDHGAYVGLSAHIRM